MSLEESNPHSQTERERQSTNDFINCLINLSGDGLDVHGDKVLVELILNIYNRGDLSLEEMKEVYDAFLPLSAWAASQMDEEWNLLYPEIGRRIKRRLRGEESWWEIFWATWMRNLSWGEEEKKVKEAWEKVLLLIETIERTPKGSPELSPSPHPSESPSM